jgi:hypothetical protein
MYGDRFVSAECKLAEGPALKVFHACYCKLGTAGGPPSQPLYASVA